MKKQKHHTNRGNFPLVCYFIYCVATISIICLPFLFFPKGSDEGLTVLFLLSITWFVLSVFLFYKEKKDYFLYKIYIGFCRKFNWRARKFYRVYFTVILLYLFLIGGACAASGKYNSNTLFEEYLKTLPLVLICITILFILSYILTVIWTKNKKVSIKQIDFKNNLNQIIPIIASIIFLLFAIFEIEIIEEVAFYSLLRIIVSATLFYISFIIKNSKSILFWLAISLGILFNPIVQIHLNDSDLWNIIDVCTIIYLILYAVTKLKRIEK
jgi:ABC-type proline/glycine betaine transport system permease subunit